MGFVDKNKYKKYILGCHPLGWHVFVPFPHENVADYYSLSTKSIKNMHKMTVKIVPSGDLYNPKKKKTKKNPVFL